MAMLILLKTPDGRPPGERIPLGTTPVIIGRDPDQSQVVLPINPVSRKHAEISFSQGRYFLQDLSSKNKTYLNSKEVAPETPQALKEGDSVRICDFLFCFRDESKSTKSEPTGDPKDPGSSLDDPDTNTLEATLRRASAAELLDSQPIDKLKAIIAISAALSKTLDLKLLFPQISKELFKIFRQADRCFIIEVNEITGDLIPVVAEQLRPSPGGDRFSRTIVKKCLSSLESYITENASADKNLSAAQSIAEFRIRSAMCVPLATADGKRLGAIYLDSQDRSKKFTQDDLKLLAAVANQASVAIENAHFHVELVQREKDMAKELADTRAARDVQHGFLPQTLPQVDDYSFFTHYDSARNVGGDYYDFLNLIDGNLAILLGDVSGKGVPAALLMARFSGEARVSMHTQPNLASAIRHLNNQLMAANLNDRYVTLIASVLDPCKHEVSFVNAGHAQSWVLRFNTKELERTVPDDRGGFAVGWVPDYEYEAVKTSLNPGDIVILCTDGIYDAEAVDGKRFEVEGFIKTVKTAAEFDLMTPATLGQRIIQAVEAHAANHPQFDDIALVCFGRANPAPLTSLNDLDLG